MLYEIPGVESYRGNASADLGIHFLGGGMAGITAATATYPLDLVRTRLAAQVMNSAFTLVAATYANFPSTLSCLGVYISS